VFEQRKEASRRETLFDDRIPDLESRMP